MATHSVKSKRSDKPAASVSQAGRLGWRGIVVAVLTIIGLTALTSYTLVHWTERQILTTDNWVQVVAPLPQNEEVASALSAYSVNRLFTNLDLENRISEALPERAAFLSAPLAEQLEEWLTKGTKNVIQSDRFATVWESANRAASERLLESARGTGKEVPAAESREARFNLDLSALRTTVQSLLEQRRERQPAETGEASPAVAGNTTEETANQPPRDVGVVVSLKASLDKVRSYIRLIDFLNATLWLVALACLLGALVVSRARRRVFLLMSLVVVIVALLQLIGVNALRPAVLEAVQESAYRPAVGVVYDTLLESFRSSATVLFAIGVVAFILAYLLHPKLWRRSSAVSGLLDRIDASAVLGWLRNFRQLVRRYRFHIIIASLLTGLIVMAFALELDWQGILRSVLVLIIAVEVIYLVSARPEVAPMEQ